MLRVRREQFRYMKNKYLTKFLCLTLMSGMVLSGPASILAAEEVPVYTSEDGSSDFSDSSDFGSEPEDPTPTPADPTPTPADPTPTPADQITAAAQDVIKRITELNAQEVTLEKKSISEYPYSLQCPF